MYLVLYAGGSGEGATGSAKAARRQLRSRAVDRRFSLPQQFSSNEGIADCIHACTLMEL